MATITYDSTAINDGSNLIISRIGHELTADRDINTQRIASRDGLVYIESQYGAKVISCEGYIIGSSANDLDTRIITLQELFSRKQKDLDIQYDGADIGTIRYVSTPRNFVIKRDYYHITTVPFNVDFFVPEGVGKATTLISGNETGITTDGHTFSLTMSGSADPKPLLTMTLNDSNIVEYIKVMNATTNTAVTVGSGFFADSDVIKIDCDELTTTINNTNTTFSGIIPTFNIGTNNINIGIYGNEEILNEEAVIPGILSSEVCEGDQKLAQSFQVQTNTSLSKVLLQIKKVGSPTFTTLNLEIQTDTAGSPSGSEVANGTSSISINDIGTDYGFIPFVFSTLPSLTASTTYWIVISDPDGGWPIDASNCIRWNQDLAATVGYTNGVGKRYNPFTAWVILNSPNGGDFGFRAYTNAGIPTFNLDFCMQYYKTYR